jgi:hypothetical protein
MPMRTPKTSRARILIRSQPFSAFSDRSIASRPPAEHLIVFAAVITNDLAIERLRRREVGS